MKDNYDDKISVEQEFGDVRVAFEMDDPNGKFIVRYLTPKKARKLARKINQAASALEINEAGRFA